NNTSSIEKADRHQLLPMSFGQQRLWVLGQTLPDPAAYNVPVAYRLRGRVDARRLRECLVAIMDRHEVLRTALVQEGEDLTQRISAAAVVALPWEEADLGQAPAAQKQAVVEKQLATEVRRPFDLTRAPLWRALWLTLAEDEHILALTFHHSVVDEWSLRLFFKECEQLYSAGGDMELAGLSKLPVQYADYALRQKRRLTGPRLERLRAYWNEQLRDLPPALELPTDGMRPAQPSGRGAVHRFQLSGELVEGLRGLARREEASLFCLMMASFQVWLHRWTGESDVVVGTPVANRECAEVQPLLGFFLNTVPIRTRLEGALRFRDLLGAVRETVLGALNHADLPFEQMVEMAAQRRNRNQSPLHQVMFVLVEEGLPKWALGQAQAQPLLVDTSASKYQLVLSVTAEGPVWNCQFEYATDLFTAENVARTAAHFTELLHSIAAHPEEPIGRLNLLRPEERRRLLIEWNRTERGYPRDKCVHQLFEEQVERTPEAVAVEFEGQKLTYRELNQRSNQLAHHLCRLGLRTEALVALFLERSLEMVVAIYGTMKAGGVYVPIDPTYPPDRVTFMLRDASPSVILTQEKLFKKLPVIPAQVISLDGDSEAIERKSKDSPRTGVGPDNLAYVIYTSGSTGQPKGVMNTHRGIVNRVIWMQDEYELGANDKVLQKTPFSFDVSVWEFFWPLLAGARLVVARPEGHRDSAYLLNLIIQRQITTLHFVPSMLKIFLQETGASDCGSLRRVICSGEALSIGSQRSFFDRLRRVELHNLYGPTEAAVDVTYWACKPHSNLRIVPIGRPIANIQIYILDEDFKPMPAGTVGELCIAGVGLARGYLNRPELTAQKFVPNPFATEPGARLYLTGDLARYLPDCNIEFLGRADHQVKVRGFRIELGEIEAVLGAHPALSHCCVIIQQDSIGDNSLTAVLVKRDASDLSSSKLRGWLEQKLPGYMIPSRFFVLPALPVTPNGKVDRIALAKLEGVELAAGSDYVAPRNELECSL
ncbi:MAG TPA: amino acid adenylation domain-containing protein, partial [Patescibacteria group bacterium]|nr:amino acid adenylation domain-containing protein [Patescibacteria group bacterium]